MSEVRRAYRRLARRLHPDLGAGEAAAERFKEITAAYNLLTGRRPAHAERPRSARADRRPPSSDGARNGARSARARARVDDVDHDAAWAAWWTRAQAAARATVRSAAPESEAGAPEPPPAPEPEITAADPMPPAPEAAPRPEPGPIGRLWSGSRELLARLRVRTGGAVAGSRLKGEDVTLRLPLDLDTVEHGGERRLAITRAAACPSCVRGGDPACICGGAGRIKVRDKVRVVIPPGAYPGARLRLAGKGTAGLAGHLDGDLYLQLEPDPVPGFRREGPDLHAVIDVETRLAARGGELRIRLPRGSACLTVPPGTRDGARFRLRGLGLPRWGGGPRGDVILRVSLV